MSSTNIGSWADAGDEGAAPEIIHNEDGTKTVVTYRLNQDGKKVKITQKIKDVKVQEKVHPSIAKRKTWAKFGKEKNSAPGPDTSTTQLGEKVELKLGLSWKQDEREEEANKTAHRDQAVAIQTIKCRTCGGDHYTSKCPFKDTLGIGKPSGDAASAVDPSNGTGRYVPKHRRLNADGTMPKDTRDDSTTLKVAQLNTFVDEDMLRNELFGNYGPLQRVTIVKNRDTGESKGFAYVSFATEEIAQRAIDNLHGKGYHSLILQIEWSKKKKPVLEL